MEGGPQGPYAGLCTASRRSNERLAFWPHGRGCSPSCMRYRKAPAAAGKPGTGACRGPAGGVGSSCWGCEARGELVGVGWQLLRYYLSQDRGASALVRAGICHQTAGPVAAGALCSPVATACPWALQGAPLVYVSVPAPWLGVLQSVLGSAWRGCLWRCVVLRTGPHGHACSKSMCLGG